MKQTINHVTLSYEVYGQGKTIYFLHGLGLNNKSMSTIYEPLFTENDRFRRVYIDLPGMGSSLTSKTLNSSDAVLHCIKTFIQTDTENDKIAICGHSYGGYLALGLNYLLADRISTIFLTCPVTIADATKRIKEPHLSIQKEQVFPTINKASFPDYLSMNVQIHPQSWIMYQKSILPGLETFNEAFWTKLQEKSYSFSSEDSLSLVNRHTKLKGHVLLGKNDAIVGYKDQKKFFEPFSTIDVTILDQAGHNLPIDVPEQLSTYFQSFLTTV